MLEPTDMEVDTPPEFFDHWEQLKRKLDDDMPPDDLVEFVQLLGNKLQVRTQTNFPSEILTYLEHDNSEREALTKIKHVLGEMNYHHDNIQPKSYVSIIEEYEREISSIPRIEHFVGRKDELKAILEIFSQSSDIHGCWIYGMGGMGKTSLVKEVCARVSQKFEVCWIDLRSSDKFTDMLKVFLERLGCSAIDLPEDNLTAHALEYIRTIEHDTAIVFDNIEDVYEKNQEEVEEFVECMVEHIKEQNAKVKLLFTSRLRIQQYKEEHVRLFHLQLLGEHDAEKLAVILSKSVKVDKDKLKAVFADRIPLSIRLKTSNLLQWYETGLPVSDEYLRNLSTMAMDECVRYELEHLATAKKQHLAKLMIFETSYFDIDEAAVALGENTCAAHHSLISFVKKQLVQESFSQCKSQFSGFGGQCRYTIHPVVFTVLTGVFKDEQSRMWKCQAKAELCKLTLRRIDEECKGNIDKFYSRAIKFIFESRMRMEILFSCLSDIDTNVDVTDRQQENLKHIITITMPISKREEILRNIADAYSRQGDMMRFWFWTMEQVKCILELKCFDEAFSMISNSIEQTGFRRQVHRNSVLMTEYYLTKGRVLRGQTKYDEAFELQMKASEYCAEDDIPRQAEVYNAIGNILHDMEDYDESYKYHKMAVDKMKTYVNEESTPDMSVYTFNLGTIAFAKGQQKTASGEDTCEAIHLYKDALEYYNESINYDKRMKLDSLISYSDKLKIRARTYRQLKDYEKAIKDAVEAVEIKERLLKKGPKEGQILGYYQVAELYKKRREYRLKKKEPNCSEDLKESFRWFNKAAELILLSYEHGLSPDNIESRSFAKDYCEVARSLSDKLGRKADTFCREFLAGDYFKPESESDSSENIPQSSDSDLMGELSDDDAFTRRDSGISRASVSGMDAYNRRDSGISGTSVSSMDAYNMRDSGISRASVSSMDAYNRRDSGISRASVSNINPQMMTNSTNRQFSFGSQTYSMEEQDEIFMEDDEAISTVDSSTAVKRKRTSSD